MAELSHKAMKEDEWMDGYKDGWIGNEIGKLEPEGKANFGFYMVFNLKYTCV